MKISVLIVAAVLASASPAFAQNRQITPRGTGGFGSDSTTLTSDSIDARMEGPETNRSFQKFISGSVSLSRVPASGVPTPNGLPVSAAAPAL